MTRKVEFYKIIHCHSGDFVRFCMRSDYCGCCQINKITDDGFPRREGKEGKFLLIFSNDYKVNNHPITKNKPIYHARNVNRWKGSVDPRPFICSLILDGINWFIFWSWGSYLLFVTTSQHRGEDLSTDRPRSHLHILMRKMYVYQNGAYKCPSK